MIKQLLYKLFKLINNKINLNLLIYFLYCIYIIYNIFINNLFINYSFVHTTFLIPFLILLLVSFFYLS